ncbi:unnamed protein product [Ectocarpus sp. 4 AP-2014]
MGSGRFFESPYPLPSVPLSLPRTSPCEISTIKTDSSLVSFSRGKPVSLGCFSLFSKRGATTTVLCGHTHSLLEQDNIFVTGFLLMWKSWRNLSFFGVCVPACLWP